MTWLNETRSTSNVGFWLRDLDAKRPCGPLSRLIRDRCFNNERNIIRVYPPLDVDVAWVAALPRNEKLQCLVPDGPVV